MSDPQKMAFDPSKVIQSADGVTSPVTYSSASQPGWLHVDLRMSGEALNELGRVSREKNEPMDSIVGKAFLLYLAATDAQREGKRIVIASADGTPETELTGF